MANGTVGCLILHCPGGRLMRLTPTFCTVSGDRQITDAPRSASQKKGAWNGPRGALFGNADFKGRITDGVAGPRRMLREEPGPFATL